MRSLLLYIFTCLLIVQPIYSTKNAQLYSSTNNSAFSLTYYAGETQGNIPLAEGSNIMDALSNITPTSCDPTSTTFVGWTDTHIPEKSNETPQVLSNSATMPASNYTVYAVFAKEEAGTPIPGGNLFTNKNSWRTDGVDNSYDEYIQFKRNGAYVWSPTLNDKDHYHLIIKYKVGYLILYYPKFKLSSSTSHHAIRDTQDSLCGSVPCFSSLVSPS